MKRQGEGRKLQDSAGWMREPVNETADPGSTTEDSLGVGVLPSFTEKKREAHSENAGLKRLSHCTHMHNGTNTLLHLLYTSYIKVTLNRSLPLLHEPTTKLTWHDKSFIIITPISEDASLHNINKNIFLQRCLYFLNRLIAGCPGENDTCMSNNHPITSFVSRGKNTVCLSYAFLFFPITWDDKSLKWFQ